jgi:quinol monooxygenase YgiN
VVIASFRLFPARERRRQMLGILQAIQGPTKARPHCVSCQLYEENGYEQAVMYVERWDSDSEFHNHVRSDSYRQVLEAAELSWRAPEIQFHHVAETRGLDLLEELRTGNKPQSLGPHERQ